MVDRDNDLYAQAKDTFAEVHMGNGATEQRRKVKSTTNHLTGTLDHHEPQKPAQSHCRLARGRP